MVTVTRYRDGIRWQVRWDEWQTIVEEDGVPRKRRKWSSKVVDRKADANALAAKIRQAHDRDERYVPESERPVTTIGALALAYVRAAVDRGAPIATQRFRSSTLQTFLRYTGEDAPASDLSLSLLRRYATSLPQEGREAHTRYRKVLEAERMWAWAYRHRGDFPGVPLPERLTGADGDLRPPPPVVAVAAPTWNDVDRMLAHLNQREWHRRLGVLLRFTGLRVSQALSLPWRDVDLDRGVLTLRAGVPGAKKGRTRALPIHPSLIEEMAGWGMREGLLFARPDGRPWRGDAPLEPFRRAWRLADIDPKKWSIPDDAGSLPGDRAHARPTHAIRACVRSGLIREGVDEQVVLMLVGHSQGATAAAYVPEGSAEESPWWTRMVEGVAKIPQIDMARHVIPLASSR